VNCETDSRHIFIGFVVNNCLKEALVFGALCLTTLRSQRQVKHSHPSSVWLHWRDGRFSAWRGVSVRENTNEQGKEQNNKCDNRREHQEPEDHQ